MKISLLLSTLFVGASSFAVVPQTPRRCTALAGMLPEEEMSADQLEIKKISDKWSEIRQLSKEEAESQLEGEWLEAYNRFFNKYHEDMEKMQQIATIVQKQIEPKKVERKGKKQRKRDKWAIVQEREAARAAAAAAAHR